MKQSDTLTIKQSGQMLLEILISVAVVAIVVSLGAQLIIVSLRSNKASVEKNVGLGLANEESDSLEAVATEKWQNIYNLTKNSVNYFTQNNGSGRLVTATGTESVTLNNIAYSRSFIDQNICRDTSTRSITGITDSSGTATTCAGSGGGFDPSTQKITNTISWSSGANQLSESYYIARWRNKICVQTAWSSTGSGTNTCPSTVYSTSTNITTGSNLTICPSGC